MVKKIHDFLRWCSSKVTVAGTNSYIPLFPFLCVQKCAKRSARTHSPVEWRTEPSVHTDTYIQFSSVSGLHFCPFAFVLFFCTISMKSSDVNVYTNISIYINIDTHMYTYMYIHMYVYINIYIYIYVFVYAHIYIHTYIPIYICTLVYIYKISQIHSITRAHAGIEKRQRLSPFPPSSE